MGNQNQCCEKSHQQNIYQNLFDKRISECASTSNESLGYFIVNYKLSSSAVQSKIILKPTTLDFPTVPAMFHVGQLLSPFPVEQSPTDRQFIVFRSNDEADLAMLQCNVKVVNTGNYEALVASPSGDWLFEGLIEG